MFEVLLSILTTSGVSVAVYAYHCYKFRGSETSRPLPQAPPVARCSRQDPRSDSMMSAHCQHERRSRTLVWVFQLLPEGNRRHGIVDVAPDGTGLLRRRWMCSRVRKCLVDQVWPCLPWGSRRFLATGRRLARPVAIHVD